MKRFLKRLKLPGQSGDRRSARAVLDNFSITMAGQVGAVALGFVTLAINTRALGLTALGTLFLVQATCELTAKICSFQNWQTVAKFGAQALHERDADRLVAVWRYGFLLDMVAAALAALIAGAILLAVPERIGIDRDTATLALVYAGSLLLTGPGASVGALRILGAFRSVVVNDITLAVLLLVNALVLWQAQAPLSFYLVTIPVITGGMAAFLSLKGYLRCRRAAREIGRDGGSGLPLDFRTFFHFALGASASTTLNSVRQRGEILIVGALVGPTASALYGVAYRIAALFARVGEAGRQSIYPVLAKLVAEGKFGEAFRLSFLVLRLGLLVSVPGLALIFVFGGDILRLLFGENYVAATPNLVLLSTATALYVVSFAAGCLIQIDMGTSRYLLLNVIAFVAGFLPLTVLGPWMFGAAGAGLGAAAFNLLLAALTVLQLLRRARQRRES